MDLFLKGKRVLITGASQGIGRGLAEVFAAEGCDLHLVARSKSNLDHLERELKEKHSINIVSQCVDLEKANSCERIFSEAGNIDILINNAGAIPGGNLRQVDEGRWREGWEVKVFGYINLTRLFYEQMRNSGEGVILNNIGNGGENFDANYIAGTTGNAALMAFTRALGGRSLDDGIRVVGVNPGPVNTDRIIKLQKARAVEKFGDEARFEELMSNYPLGRAAHVSEVADLFAFLASPRSAYTSGTIVTVDGGLTSCRSI